MKIKAGYSFLPLGALLYLLAVIVLTFTPVIAYFPFFTKQWIIWLLVFIVSLVVSPSVYQTQRFYIILLYALVLLVNVAMGDMYFNTNVAIREVCYLLIPLIIFQYCVTGENGDKLSFWLIVAIILIILIEAIATLLLDIVNPGILRMSFSDALTSGYNRQSYMTHYYKLGMSNYSLPHALPILIPASIFGIKANRGFVRMVWSVFLFAILLLIWLSGAATALLLATFITMSALFTKIGQRVQNVTVLVLLLTIILPFLLSDSLSLWLLDKIEIVVSGNNYFMSKVAIFRETILYGTAQGDVAARRDLYIKSFELFKTNVLLGTNEAVGNHSALLDRLSALGLFGFSFYVAYLFKQFQFTKCTIGGQGLFFYFEGVLVGVIMLLLKDVDNWETYLVLFTVMPLQIRLIEKGSIGQTKEVIR